MARSGRSSATLGSVPVSVSAGVRHPSPVSLMSPVSSGSGRGNQTAGVLPAISSASQDSEGQAAPSGAYEVQVQSSDSQCDPAKALKASFDTLWAGPRYSMMLGGACPPVTALIARSSPSLGLSQVSFVAPPTNPSNRKWYRHLFSTAPSFRAVNSATVKSSQRYRWKRIGLLTQDRPGPSEMRRDSSRQSSKTDIQSAASQSFSEDACSSSKKSKDEDVRIIVGQFEDGSVTEVFCCAYRSNSFGPRYQWILAAGGPSGWRSGWQSSGCSANDLSVAADGSLRSQVRQLGSSDAPGVSGRTPQEYSESYSQQSVREGSEVSPLHAFAYDAVWVAARASVQVEEASKLRGRNGSSRNATVSEEEEGRMSSEAVKRTQFEGVTGPVSFRNGERMTAIDSIQLQGDSGVSVGEFSTGHQQVRIQKQLLKFKGPGPAKDQVSVVERHRRVGLLSFAIVSSAAAVTIFITLILLCLVSIGRCCWFRMSGSSSQDESLSSGLSSSSSSVLFSGSDGTSSPDRTLEVLCSVRSWTSTVGHTSGFLASFSRTWMVYSLCRVQSKESGRVQFWILSSDLSVSTSWQLSDPLRRVVSQHSPEESSEDVDVVIRPYSELCSSANMESWLTAVYGYKAPSSGSGCFSAWNIWATDHGPPALSCRISALGMFSLTAFSVSGAWGASSTSSRPATQFCLCSVLILSWNLFISIGSSGPQLYWTSCCSDGGGKHQQVSESQAEAAEEEGVARSRRLNQDSRSQSAQSDVQIETITMELSGTLWDESGDAAASSPTHIASVCEEKPPGVDDINSPERVRRRSSVQSPILHHSYLPVVGGVSSSCSSLFDSQEVFLDHHRKIQQSMQTNC